MSRKSYIAQASRKFFTLTTLTHVPSSHEKTQKNEKPALTAQRKQKTLQRTRQFTLRKAAFLLIGATVGYVRLPITEVQLKVPFMRNTHRIAAGEQQIVDWQEEVPCFINANGKGAVEITGQEFHIPETSDEDEDPQWIQTGPEYSSDCSGDGPDSSEDYDPQQDKARKRKRNIAKAVRRLRRKRNQADEKRDRTTDINQQAERRSQRRKAGEKRDRTADINQQAETRSQRVKAGEK